MNVIVNNLLVNYALEGDRNSPTVVLLHGWGSSLKAYGQLSASLAARFRVIRLDFPGFGGSQVPPESWRIADFAQFTADFLKKIEVSSPAALIGHSFGGRVILKGVGTGVLQADQIILMGSAGIKHSDSARNLGYMLVAKAGKAATALPGLKSLRAGLRRKLYQSAGNDDYLTAGPMRTIFVHTISEDLRSDAAAIRIPALLIWGAEDAETPLADGRLLADSITASQLVIIPAAGHYVFSDAPTDTLAHIERFLS
jgi:pimeloyl-ACP methyl ester carboxylesterase